jgi:hypothetical protein
MELYIHKYVQINTISSPRCKQHPTGAVLDSSSYKYGALTDCATGAMLQIDIKVKHLYYTPLSDHLHGHFIISTLYHSCVLSFSAVPWSFYFFHDNENTSFDTVYWFDI